MLLELHQSDGVAVSGTLHTRGSPTTVQHVVVGVHKKSEESPTDVRPFDLRAHLACESRYQPLKLGILAPITPQPARLRIKWDQTRPKVPQRLIQLSSFGNVKFEVRTARSEKGLFIANPQGGQGLSWKIEVMPKSGLGVGLYDDVIIVTTDHKDVPEVRVPVFLEVTN